uniref:Cystathionine gamma-lyase n=1 Tax=Nippostrongylus brasiliensis TaxID=27835 RepID=A0A0N4XVC9_NIPBR
MWLNADSIADGSSSVEVSQISRGSDLSTHFFPRSTTVYGCVDGVQCVGRALLCNANDKKQQRRDEKARGEGQGRLIVSQTINYTIPLIEISSSSTQGDGGGGWMIFVEVIANPSMSMPNLAQIIALAQESNVLSFVDATFASPICVQPIVLGADICMHSWAKKTWDLSYLDNTLDSQHERQMMRASTLLSFFSTKYMGGHTDVIAGCVTTKTLKNYERLKMQQLTTGSALSPFDAALLARGLKTLSLRVDKICSNAGLVQHTHYPGLESHPMHEAAKAYMKKWGGMVAFDVGTAAAAIKIVEVHLIHPPKSTTENELILQSTRLIVHAVSLGGTESLMEHPLSMSHGEELLRDVDEPMVPPGLLRLSVGIEHPDDLIADLAQALALI